MAARLDQGQSLRQDDEGHGHDSQLMTCRPPLLPAPAPPFDVNEGDDDQSESTKDEHDVAPRPKHDRHRRWYDMQGHLAARM
ncbi:hypothetical protein GCM10009528_30100 [Kineococcus aurantiacus]